MTCDYHGNRQLQQCFPADVPQEYGDARTQNKQALKEISGITIHTGLLLGDPTVIRAVLIQGRQ